MILQSILLASIALLPPPVSGAVCCGVLGEKWDEASAWAIRESFCRDPRAHRATEENDPGHVVGAGEAAAGRHVMHGDALKPQYFYAKTDEGREFAHCWAATEELISQCARAGHAFGSWELGGELYGMMLTGERRQDTHIVRRNATRRSLHALPPIHSAADLQQLHSGEVWDVGGADVAIRFENTLDSLPKRDVGRRGGLRRRNEGLDTSAGTTWDWEETYRADVDLGAVIAADIAQLTAHGHLRRDAHHGPDNRWQQCGVRGDWSSAAVTHSWVTLQSGTWLHDAHAGACVGAADPAPDMSHEGREVCESFSSDIVPDETKEMIRQFARHKQFDWQVCARGTTGDTGCRDKWSQGTCHVSVSRHKMYWQRGFMINYNTLNTMISANVYFVHADGPGIDAETDCWGGCCEWCRDSLPQFTELTKDKCNAQADNEMKAWYGTCNGWTSKDCHN